MTDDQLLNLAQEAEGLTPLANETLKAELGEAEATSSGRSRTGRIHTQSSRRGRKTEAPGTHVQRLRYHALWQARFRLRRFFPDHKMGGVLLGSPAPPEESSGPMRWARGCVYTARMVPKISGTCGVRTAYAASRCHLLIRAFVYPGCVVA